MRKGYTMPLEERKQRSDALRQRWANMSDAERKRRSEIARENARRQMADPAAKARTAAALKAMWEKRGHKRLFEMTPEIRQRISAKQKGKRRAYMDDSVKMAALGKKRSAMNALRFAALGEEKHELFRPEVRVRALANSVAEGKTNPLRGKFETNSHAREWHLRDPRGNEYHFNNLLHFIRTHRHLFTAQQLEVSEQPAHKERTRAYSCLNQLSPRHKHPATTACGGWTWVRYQGEVDPRFV